MGSVHQQPVTLGTQLTLGEGEGVPLSQGKIGLTDRKRKQVLPSSATAANVNLGSVGIQLFRPPCFEAGEGIGILSGGGMMPLFRWTQRDYS